MGLTSVLFWGLAELLESNWVFAFLRSLGSYESISSIVDKLGNPYQSVTLILFLLTLWFTYRLHDAAASSVAFSGLLSWAININALIIPMFGMMHMVMMGVSFIILLNGFAQRYPPPHKLAVGGSHRHLAYRAIGFHCAAVDRGSQRLPDYHF